MSHCLQIDCFKEIIGFSSNSHRQYKETPLEKNIYFGPVPISLVLVQGAFCIFAAPELCPKKRTKLPKLDKKMPIFSRNKFVGECFLCVVSIYEEYIVIVIVISWLISLTRRLKTKRRRSLVSIGLWTEVEAALAEEPSCKIAPPQNHCHDHHRHS